MKIKRIKVRFVENLTSFNESKRYSFLTYLEGLKEGDLLVVRTRYGLALARFVEYTDGFDSVKAEKFAMAKVDLSEFYAADEKHEKIKRLKAEIDEEAKSIVEQFKLKELAKDSPKLKAMLDTLESLEEDLK